MGVLPHTCKLDPRLRRYGDRPRPAPKEQARDTISAFIEVANSDTLDWLERQKWIRDFVHIIDGYCTATLPEAHLVELAEHPGVIEVEGVRYVHPRLNQSLDRIHGRERLTEEELQTQGADVVIGIVDYGIDFTLEDFQNPRLNTRIAFLWDQAQHAEGGERPPDRFKYGVEYTSDDINRALKHADPFSIVRHRAADGSDVSGHGTHVAGIAAGNGRTADRASPAGTYVGVAPGATLVFVHLNRQTIIDQVGNPQGTLANSVNLAHAVAYCFEKAEQLNKPCVVNLSLGFNGGGHDGNMAVEWIIDALLYKSGRAVVIAAGNEHHPHKRIHYGARIRAGASVIVKWDTGDLQTSHEGASFEWGDPTPNEMEIWYSNASSLEARLVAPDGERSAWVAADDPDRSHTFARGEQVIIVSDQRTPWGGDARIHIQLNPGGSKKEIRYGTWLIELQATKVSSKDAAEGGVRFDAWIERSLPDKPDFQKWSRFREYDPSKAITLTTPATASRVIAVANSTADDGPAASSGRGPTRDNRNKPDIAAPGEFIFSANAGAGQGAPGTPARRAMSGTSMAAPHVTGVVARLLSRQNYLFAHEIRDILAETARRASGQGQPASWDRELGHGIVDAAAAVKKLEDLIAAAAFRRKRR
jgi:subtilisin family serine protease